MTYAMMEAIQLISLCVSEVFPRWDQAAVVNRPALLLQRSYGSQLLGSPGKPGPPRHVLTRRPAKLT